MRSIYVTLFLFCSFVPSSLISAQTLVGTPRPAGFVSDVQSPEDLLQLPNTDWVVVSSMQTASGTPGHLDLIDAQALSHRKAIYPSRETSVRSDLHRFPGCTPPDPGKFFPHGINILRRGVGDFELYAINHGGRESVEIFRLRVTRESVQTEWIGCVLLPSHSYGNSIAPLPNGGFVLSKMYDPQDPSFLAKFDAGAPTGTVLAWKPKRGWFQPFPQKFSGANGIEVSQDGRWLYVSEWSAQRVWKISMDVREKPKSASVSFLPDNLRWTPQGTLLLAGQNAKPSQVLGCDAKHLACPEKFTVAEIDPATLQVHNALLGGDESFGGGTGAAIVNGQLWVGSFHATQVARFNLGDDK